MLTIFCISTTQFLLATAIILLVCTIWCNYRKNTRFWYLVNKLPGPQPLPIIGNALDFYFNSKEIRDITYGSSNKYPRILKLWFGNKPHILLHDPNDIEVLLTSSRNINKGNGYKFFLPWLGNGVLTSNEITWRTHRKLLTPAFHFRILEHSLNVFNFHGKILIKQLNDQVNKNEFFDIRPLITRSVFNILCETVMGIQVNWQEKSYLQFFQVVEKYNKFSGNRLIRNYWDRNIFSIKTLIDFRQKNVFLWPNLLFNLSKTGKEHNECVKILHNFTDKIIQKKKSESKNTKSHTEQKKCLVFLDLLLQSDINGKKLTDIEIREEVTTFMFAGHDTISTSLAWTLYLLGSHIKIQEKVHQELNEVFDNDTSKDITMEDLKKLKYINCVIKESMRRLPPVPIIGRKLEEDININGYTIPAGINVIINILKLHKNASIYPNPSLFNPERFLPENNQKRHPYAFIPFSAGPRNCLGQKFSMIEETVILSHILRTYSVKSLQTLKEIKPTAHVILTSQNGIMLSFTKR